MSRLTGTVTAIGVFIDEVMIELKKSSWPTRSELIESTVVILSTLVLLGCFVGFSDLVLDKMINLLVRQ